MAYQSRLNAVLQEIGLSEREASVYLAALSHGALTPTELSRISGVSRTTVYPLLESLKRRGLVHAQSRGVKDRYVAESPERLEALIDSRRATFRNILPELQGLYTMQGGSSAIRYYEGVKSLQQVYLDILTKLRAGDFYYVVSDQQKWYDLDSQFAERYKQQRSKLQLDVRLILVDSPNARWNQKHQANYRESVRILPPQAGAVSSFLVTPYAVIINQMVAPVMAIVIENKNVVELQRRCFELIWGSIKGE